MGIKVFAKVGLTGTATHRDMGRYDPTDEQDAVIEEQLPGHEVQQRRIYPLCWVSKRHPNLQNARVDFQTDYFHSR